VISLVGDWTLRDAEIGSFLTEQRAAGVPLYLWYAPGKEAEKLPQILTQEILLQRAARDGNK
jgi:thiol:disulfide interchange protein